MKFFILFFISLFCLPTHAQYPGIKDDPETGYIIVDLSEDNPLAYYTKSDTTHYYVVFESHFQDNNVRVYCNDSLIYKDKITTDWSTEFAKKVKVGTCWFGQKDKYRNRRLAIDSYISHERKILFKN